MSEPTEIIPGVFVGDQFTAKDQLFFKKNNITRVVNCTPDVPFYFPGVRYYRIPIGDSSHFDDNDIMARNLPVAVGFIMEAQPGKYRGVLIHCHVGVSRSCTVAVALLRTCFTNTIDEAIKIVVSKRPVAFFNGNHFNFMKALKQVYGK